MHEAARGRDVVVVAIPEKNAPRLPKDFFDGAGGDVVIVDTGNYYPQHRDGGIDAIEAGMPESMWVAQASPDRPLGLRATPCSPGTFSDLA